MGQPEAKTSVSILVLPVLGCVSFPSFLSSLDLSFLVCGLVMRVVFVVGIQSPCSFVSSQPVPGGWLGHMGLNDSDCTLKLPLAKLLGLPGDLTGEKEYLGFKFHRRLLLAV